MQENYDVVVVGAGHAGCEAARACARMGLKTAMVTMNLDLIAQMSCNPAIGGIAKGHLVREIDALGGVMGEVTDAVGIQFRLLNTSRGPAVWSPRAQCDKKMYRVRMREVLEREPNLRIKQAEVAELILDVNGHRRVSGVKLRDGRAIRAGAVIVTTGTFLNGLAHVGEMTYSCGRNGEAPSQLAGRPVPHTRTCNGRASKPVPRRASTAGPLTGRNSSRSLATPMPTPFSFLTEKIDRPADRLPHRPHHRRNSPRFCKPIFIVPRSIAARSKASARATALRSKTRSSNFPTSPVTRFFSSPRASTPTRST